MEKLIELKVTKKYFCMPKLTTNLEGPTEAVIECYVPSGCYLMNQSKIGMKDQSIIMYTIDPYTLEPLSKENSIITTVPSSEVSDDYEEIRISCVQKNEKLLRAQQQPILDAYAEWFRQNEIKYFAKCYRALTTGTQKRKEKQERKG